MVDGFTFYSRTVFVNIIHFFNLLSGTDILKNQLMSTSARPTDVPSTKTMANHVPPGRRSPSSPRMPMAALVSAVRERARTPVLEETSLDEQMEDQELALRLREGPARLSRANGIEEDIELQRRFPDRATPPRERPDYAEEFTYRDQRPPLEKYTERGFAADHGYSDQNTGGYGDYRHESDRFHHANRHPDQHQQRRYPDTYADRGDYPSSASAQNALPRDLSPRSSGGPDRFSHLLNSQVVHDHFNQYGAGRQGSRDMHRGAAADRVAPPSRDVTANATTSTSSDSRTRKDRSNARRRTLPSIVDQSPSGASAAAAASSTKPPGETTHSQENLSKQGVDTFIIENGIRKRVKAEQVSASRSSVDTDKVPRGLPARYKMERAARTGATTRGSLPDVSAAAAAAEVAGRLMRREDAHKLGEKRRDQLRKEREEDERRRQQEIVLRLADVKVTLRSIFRSLIFYKSFMQKNGVSL